MKNLLLRGSATTPLHLDHIIGAGNDRNCWQHPNHADLCIKVANQQLERDQNKIESHYWQHLQKHGIHRSVHLPDYYGWAHTDKGEGLIYELVHDFDGTPSPTIFQACESGLISYDQGREFVTEAFNWMLDNNVILADYGSDNMLLRTHDDGSRSLVFIDGLGARDLNFQYWLRRTFGFKARKKTRQFFHKTLSLLQHQELTGQRPPNKKRHGFSKRQTDCGDKYYDYYTSHPTSHRTEGRA
ncbi:YrbL family protein [Brackiella oedipodis]|uniref:YrbL family protein n=1 Tax=Brackiella oedipodis TaxID=124225 RepID=UPI0004914D28|nr:YrbL family protein [Brackiella oedipodis]